MTEKERNDLFYVCSLIEFTARQTKTDQNRRRVIYLTKSAVCSKVIQ